MADYIDFQIIISEERYFKRFPEHVNLTREMITESLELLISVGLPQEEAINWDRSHPTSPVANRIRQHEDWLYMLDCKLRIRDLGKGLTLVNSKYIYSHKTGKWRVKGRGKWYRSKDLDTFIFKYVYTVVEEKTDEQRAEK